MCSTGLILTTIRRYWKRISKMASKYWATCWQGSPSPLKLRREESQSFSCSPPSLRSRSLSGLSAFFLTLCAQWIRSAVVKREFVIIPVLIRIIIVIIVTKYWRGGSQHLGERGSWISVSSGPAQSAEQVSGQLWIHRENLSHKNPTSASVLTIDWTGDTSPVTFLCPVPQLLFHGWIIHPVLLCELNKVFTMSNAVGTI